jgi:hypothetical protein
MDTRTSILPPEPNAFSRSNAPDDARAGPRRGDLREAPEAWSSEPDDDGSLPGEPREAEDELDDEPVRTLGARARAVLGPVVVTLGAAGLAFVGMRVIMGGAFEQRGVPHSTEVLGNLTIDAGDERPTAPPAVPERATERALPDAGDASGPLEGDARFDVEVSAELLDPLPQPRLVAGHGMLEVRTWEPQRIYVDGVFVGNYATRFVPLKPGTYRVRLLAGGREIQQSVRIEAGRRTRVLARNKSAQ